MRQLRNRAISVMLSLILIATLIPVHTFAAGLSAPANPHWDPDYPGMALWDKVDGATFYRVELYRGEEEEPLLQYPAVDPMIDLTGDIEENGSGSYIFRVAATDSDEGDPYEMEYGAYAESGVFEYIQPAEQLQSPAALTLNGTVLSWTAAEDVPFYTVGIFVQYPWDEIWSFYGSLDTMDTSVEMAGILMDLSYNESISGIAFAVRSVSSDITEVRSGEWSDFVVYSGELGGGDIGDGGGSSDLYEDPESISITMPTTCYVDDTDFPEVVITPEGSNQRAYTLTSSNPSVAEIDNNYVIFLAEGTVTITATTDNGLLSDSCTVTVIPAPVESVSISKETLALTVGDSYELSADITPSYAANTAVKWTSSDPTVVSVEENWSSYAHSSATLTAKKAGSATVTVTTEDGGLTASCVVTVTDPFGGATLPFISGSWLDERNRAESYSDYSYGILTIHNAKELALFAYECNTGSFSNQCKTVMLGSDIYLWGHNWEPIHTSNTFTFNGDGHIISGLTFSKELILFSDSNNTYIGLFGVADDVTVQKLELRNAAVNLAIEDDSDNLIDQVYLGMVAGKVLSVVDCSVHADITVNAGSSNTEVHVAGVVWEAMTASNCRSSGAIRVSASRGCVSGTVGQADFCTECRNYADITASNVDVGGVFCMGLGMTETCVNEGNITVYGNATVGGVGYQAYSGSFRDCYNRGVILQPASTGSIIAGGVFGEVGSYYGSSPAAAVSNCGNTGLISLSSDNGSAGGIAGIVHGTGVPMEEDEFLSACAVISNCQFTSTVTARSAGGIAYRNYGRITGCRMRGILNGSELGGIVGYNEGIVDTCENYAAFSTGSSIAGIVCYNYSNAKISGCRNYGTLSCAETSLIGGIVADNNGLIDGCANYGTLSGSVSSQVGGIAAQLTADITYGTPLLSYPCAVQHCENAGTVMAMEDSGIASGGAGGIVSGALTSSGEDYTILGCTNSGAVYGPSAGGIISHASAFSGSGTGTISQCANSGLASGEHSAGGIVGSVFTSDSSCTVVIEDVHNTGTALSRDYDSSSVGGIAGSLGCDSGTLRVSRALHRGTVGIGNNVGALIGDSYRATLNDLYYQKGGGLSWLGSGYTDSGSYPASTATALTRSQMANTASFPALDFNNVWEMSSNSPSLRLAGLAGAEAPMGSYYSSFSDTLFRFVDTSVSYPQPTNYSLKFDGLIFSTGSGRDLSIPIAIGDDDTVVCSKEGYHTYRIPGEALCSYNVITMTPATVTAPFAETLLLDKTDSSYRSYINLLSEGTTVYESDLQHRSEERLYVSVNWNGHGEGDVWLQQNNARIDLVDGGFVMTEVGSTFTAGPAIYLCGEAEDGTTFRRQTKLSIIERFVTTGFDMGSGGGVDINAGQTNSNMNFLNGYSLEYDFSALSAGLFPLKVKIDGTTFKGTIGITASNAEWEADGSPKDGSDPYFKAAKEFVEACRTKDGLPPSETLMNKKWDELTSLCEPQTHLGSVGTEGALQVVGYFYGSLVDGEYRITQCEMVLIFEGKGSVVSPFTVMGVPGYLKTTLGAQIEAVLGNWQYSEASKKLEQTGVVNLNTELSLAVEAALGFESVFSGGVEGTGKLMSKMPIPGTVNGTVLSMQAELALVGNFLGTAGELVIAKTPERIFFRNGSWCWIESSEPSAYSYAMMAAAYVNNDLTLFSEDDPAVWRSGIHVGGQAAMISLHSGKRLLVWQDAGESLYYSVYSGDNWSEAAALENDGTPDYSPVFKLVNGTAYLIWNDLSAAPEDGNVLQRAATSQLSVARFNGTGFDILGTVGAENTLNSASEITELSGAPVLRWNSATVTGSQFGTPMAKYAIFENNTWTEYADGALLGWDDDVLSEDTPEVPGISARVKRNSTDGIVYISGESVMGMFRDGGSWGEAMKLADLPANAVVYSLNAEYSEKGNLLVALTCGSVTGEIGTSTFGQTDLLLFELTPASDIAVTEVGYQPNTLMAGGTLSMWASVQNNSSSAIRTLTVSIDGKPTDITVDIPSGAEERVYFTLPLSESAASIPASCTVTVSSSDVKENNTSNNTLSCAIRKADISVEGLSVSVYEDAAESGEATVLLVNRGLEPLSNVDVRLYDMSDDQLLAEQTVASLEAGAATTVHFTNLPLEAEEMVSVQATSEGTEENFTSNNTDLSTVMYVAAERSTLIAGISNIERTGTEVRVDWFVDNTLSSDQTVSLAIALYNDNGQMLDLRLLNNQTVSSADSRHDQSVLTCNSEEGELYVKLFLLQGDGSYLPLTAAQRVDVQA